MYKQIFDLDKLTELGWNVIVVWECELRHGDEDKRLQELVEEIKGNVS